MSYPIDILGGEILEPTDYKLLYEELRMKCAEQEFLIISLRKEVRELRLREVPLSNRGYEYLTNLQYKVKSLVDQVCNFKSGEKYVEMQAEHKRNIAIKDREIKSLKQELAGAHLQVVNARNNWLQVIDDLEKEHAKALEKKDRELKALEEKLLKTQIAFDEQKDKLRESLKELYQAKTELDDEKGKVLQLKAQINRDYENSSQPSSSKPKHKKVTNNRQKSGKRPGGQVGHKWHPTKKHIPTNSIYIPAPKEYTDSPDYKLTGRIITKQLVDIRINIIVTEYSTPEFRHRVTRQRVHAGFPEDLVNEVTYSGNVKAFAFLLNNHCNVSVAKVSDFLSELTGGELKISTGMISGLSKQFSHKTEADRKKAFSDLLLSPVINTDFTSIRVNGKNMNVLVCATPSIVMYFAKEHKGHEGIKGTPIETYQGTMVHDHDITFYNYGCNHQECNDHPLRYLKGNMENEPGLKWSSQMRELIQEMIHFRKHLDPNDKRNPDQIDPKRVADLEARYDKILDLAQEEYDYEPPSKYNVDGFNLFKRLRKYKANHLLFLHDGSVPYSNSLAERMLRVCKRKQAQVMTFRSPDGFDYYCQSLGIVSSLREQSSNLYESVAEIFDRQISESAININTS